MYGIETNIADAAGIVSEGKWQSDAPAGRQDDGEANTDGPVGWVHGLGGPTEIVVASTGNGRGSGASDGRELGKRGRAEKDNYDGSEQEQDETRKAQGASGSGPQTLGG